ncbi:geranylgeranyl transferase type-1 subunit beta-like [Chenopodium quinoa]|uniref:geranylgeranyl transferase type-1 subunit beta-like n=1 Tax=Chenopodium quinoa TaxID=63459 RepID=UPI000B792252|nr:geranylgeranyl transferase type-1 subunit beta-like [Chenopodium quinoa]
MASKLTQPFSIDPSFDKDRHVRFLDMMYELLPSDYESQEINHLTLAYFTLSSLDILGALDRVDKEAIVAWVLSFQAHKKDQDDLRSGQFYGFLGSRSSQFPADALKNSNCNSSHLASTYSALAILKILGYDFSLFDSESILRSMRNLQQSDGSFMPIHIGAEADLRFVYCAAAISYLLDDWTGMDKEMAKEYILNCQSYDGGFGLCPGVESHGGATYCAIASLRLMGFIEDDLLSKGVSSSIIDIPVLLDWMMQRQAADGGFQGRLNKPSDTCYAFWVGGVLKILGGSKFVNKEALRDSLLTCQSVYGGFSKFPGELPELYHSYYGFSAYSLLEEPTLNSLCVELGITKRAASGS